MPTGRVFNIQRYCLHDGPGIRTTVFLKGCPLRCHWCHNPESQDPRPEIAYHASRCGHCGACTEACPLHDPVFERDKDPNPGRCIRCGACVRACPSDARQGFGQDMTVQQVMAEVLKDQLFYDDSGGGVTISGGEPLSQGEFLLALLECCREAGLHTAVDTCGHGSTELLLAVAKFTDLFLYDLKMLDESRHEQYTGVTNSAILENLRLLARHHGQIWLRVPVIPGINDAPEHLAEIARLAAKMPSIRQVNLLPYHETAAGKLSRLGQPDRMEGVRPPDEQAMAAALRPFVEQRLTAFEGG